MQNAQKIKVGLVGARGYAGLELARILLAHPKVELSLCFSGESAFALSDYLPEPAAKKVKVQPLSEIDAYLPELNTVFLATPAEISLKWTPKILPFCNIIDLSGAFRLQKGSAQQRQARYLEWYHAEHSALGLLDEAIFGLSPFAKISRSAQPQLIANPGCYATSVMMALIPLLKAGALEKNIIIDAKSGVSGAGRKASEYLLFNEVAGECLPYRVGKHQHLPEICEHTEAFSGRAIDPFFTTHLLPVRRGIISSIYAELKDQSVCINKIYEEAFRDYPLVRFGEVDSKAAMMPSSLGLSLKKVVGTARSHIYFKRVDNKFYLFSLLDNLLKGAASQAVENFNLLQGWPVATALEHMEGNL